MLRADDSQCATLSRTFEPIVRKRIVDLFRAAAASRVTLVVAPAGFGKSVAVRHFLEHDETNYVWLNFRNEHETLLGFLQGFTSAISSFAPGAVETAAAVYEQANSSKTCAADIASWLTTLLQNYSGTIVLDDLHRSGGDPRISELVAELVDRSSGSCRWIIATRDVLTLPMASWVGYGLLQRPIVYSDLLVSHNEAAEIAERAGTCFTAGELHEMLTLTQAWPVAFAFLLNASTRTTDLRLVAQRAHEKWFTHFSPSRSCVNSILPNVSSCSILRSSRPYTRICSKRRAIRTRVKLWNEYAGVPPSYRVKRTASCAIMTSSAIFSRTSCARAARTVTRLHAEKQRTLLAGSGRAIEALELFTRAGASDEILSLLDRVGFELLDLGKGDVVENAVTAIEYRETVESPVQLVILAHLCRVKGDASGAERLFVRALSAAADPTLRADIALRYVTFLCYPNQRYAEALEVLDNVSVSSVKSRAIRARCIARRAVLLSYLGAQGRGLQACRVRSLRSQRDGRLFAAATHRN